MPAHQRHDGDPLTTQASVKAVASPRFRRPRNLIVLALALVAVIVGVFVIVNQDSGRGSATVRRTTPSPITSPRTAIAARQSGPVSRGLQPSRSLPPGWSDAGPDTPSGAYAEILYDDATDPDDVPFVEVILSRLEGPRRSKRRCLSTLRSRLQEPSGLQVGVRADG